MDKDNIIAVLEKKSKRTLLIERCQLQDQQKALRERRDELDKQKRKLKDDLEPMEQSSGQDDKDKISTLNRQIKSIEEEISKISDVHMQNAEILEIYSRILKTDEESKSTVISSLIGAVTGFGSMFLGWISLKKAFQSDVDGTMVNKRTLDVFNRLNPIRLIKK